MARTIQQIQNSIYSEKNNYSELSSLNSTSTTAVYRLWIYITAVSIWTLEKLFDLHRAEVDVKLNIGRYGTGEWLAEQILKFQLGDTLSIVDNQIAYPNLDPNKQIVTRVSIVPTTGSSVTVKVAKGDINDVTNAEALTSPELNQLKVYVNEVKPVGVEINTISLNSDRLILSGATVYYDGINSESIIQDRVEAALLNYMQTLRFDGFVFTNEVINAIQNVEGVRDVTIDNLIVKKGAINNVVDRKEETASGYLNEDDTDTFESTITYSIEQ